MLIGAFDLYQLSRSLQWVLVIDSASKLVKSFGRLHLHLFAPYRKTFVFPLTLVDIV